MTPFYNNFTTNRRGAPGYSTTSGVPAPLGVFTLPQPWNLCLVFSAYPCYKPWLSPQQLPDFGQPYYFFFGLPPALFSAINFIKINFEFLKCAGYYFIFRLYGNFRKNDVLLGNLGTMTSESYLDFSSWFETTNQGRWVSKAVTSYEGEVIGLKCRYCQHLPFPVSKQSTGKGWNIGSFTRHLNTEKVCPNQVLEASISMDTSKNVTMTLY